MPFRCMRMHCPGDENIIPIYRPNDTSTDAADSTSSSSIIVTHIEGKQDNGDAPQLNLVNQVSPAKHTTSSQVSMAAPKSDMGTYMTSEELRQLAREEKERDYWMMKDLEEGVADWLSDSEFEEPEMNPKYDHDSFALSDIPINGSGLQVDNLQNYPATNPIFSTDLAMQTPILLDLGTTKSLIKPVQAYTEFIKLREPLTIGKQPEVVIIGIGHVGGLRDVLQPESTSTPALLSFTNYLDA